ncbi:thioredoxin-dependent thiol peroxidase [Venatoribacter cucullus]|uniref:thioredoxin-dependent thiol peroxidase n=1 Tax=Venatoribacter cucullus TaxID=2661630 RepID=UPI0019357C08|nr:thioredoxin-dependent thiol peroxidase [Venatoribacter cucullus]QQD21996.1 thioredoxin-dependent thiol peroxidase [Oceanospirillaceae bacterium ASx5O]UZK04053.1 thioredoxin-dependent thiol peroxidase [Venatoribacter cucullus]
MSLKLPALNQPAPAFSAPDQHGNIVTLDSLRGRNVVLYFYPKAMTPGCTVQACGIRDHHAEFAALNTLVLGISPDAPQRLQKFIERDQLNFDLLSDEDHAIADAYGVWALKKFMGKEYEGIHRITFIIDAQGVLRHIIEKVKTKTHHDDTLALVKTL